MIQANLASLDDLDLRAADRNLIPNALVLDLVAVDHLALLLALLVVLFADAAAVKSSATTGGGHLVRRTWLVNFSHQLE